MQSVIYIEPSEDRLDPIVKQIATKLRKIPVRFRGPIKGIAIGTHLEGKEGELSGLVDELIIVGVPRGNEYNTEVLSKILADLLKVNSPSLLFLGFSHQGMELAPIMGWRLGVPIITSCVDFSLVDHSAVVKRLIYSSKLSASFCVNIERGAIFSIQKGGWKEAEEAEVEGFTSPSVTKLPWRENWAAEKSEILKIIEAEESAGEEDITKADILVSGGRGIGGPQNLPILQELAKRLGGMISCSRPVVDNGWLPATRQVGMSGRTVAPIVYLALGISGQGNHVVGMDTSKIIIAVNKDPGAPIFKVAHYGVIDNLLEFIPELLKQIRKEN